MTETTTQAPPPRLKVRYREEIRDQLRDEFSFGNVMQVPGLTKVVVNMGVGEAARDSKLIEGATKDLAAITGQKAAVTRARREYCAERVVPVYEAAYGEVVGGEAFPRRG